MGQACCQNEQDFYPVDGTPALSIMEIVKQNPVCMPDGDGNYSCGEMLTLEGSTPSCYMTDAMAEEVVACDPTLHAMTSSNRRAGKDMSPMEVSNMDAVEDARISPWARPDSAPPEYLADSMSNFEIVVSRTQEGLLATEQEFFTQEPAPPLNSQVCA
mmetsp:Transcript_38413/g.99228  ORF Transcript_38413/g.99228 Transcript_38413/m.99228 type:complete len:158 (+) Transcript_38413:44-517(+)|eukprot:CAMPEP_0195119150 /NCGR_PEP_ID=MMETSP0448-20130528/118680_1 /TAXON_ID=66468 /ORGANISM="Heterocapsa triquestra, Strain CCMP 448" /LENGTH=157 /DNA_ID=CAMNT_0040156455 /DNA_START=40 /DNA_END=513 /DNA_ORIENTATION=+